MIIELKISYLIWPKTLLKFKITLVLSNPSERSSLKKEFIALKLNLSFLKLFRLKNKE
jgi:hypothetical protein